MISRRPVLLSLLSVPLVAACGSSDDETATGDDAKAAAEATKKTFPHGVASGDAADDRVILWTRVTTTDATAAVTWTVATDRAMSNVVAQGSFDTSADRDFTVKVDATGLAAATTYYYRFQTKGAFSPVGRTRTTGQLANLRAGIVSCSSLAHGYFHAYRELAKQADLDCVIHLGDYIYEYGTAEYGDARTYEPDHEIVTLADYRQRHAQYKRDPDLQAVHRQHGFYVIWDDHEIADNGWKGGAKNHQADEGSFAERKAAALQAYFEWMPIRDTPDRHIYRTAKWGDLAELILLDTRYWGRDLQVKEEPAKADLARQLLGADQEAWFKTEITSSTTTWRLVGQQILVAPFNFYNEDGWDGYPGARARFYDSIKASKGNVVVLTGDIHTSWANDLPLDPATYDPATGAGALAVEFVVPGVSSPGPGSLGDAFAAIAKEAKFVKYVDGKYRGFGVLDVTKERVQMAFYQYDTPEETTVPVSYASAWSVAAGTPKLVADSAAAPAKTDPPALAS